MSKKYLCIVRSSPGACEMPAPADMEAMYARFNAWREKFQANLEDLGGRLGEAGAVVTTEGRRDGPLVEAKEVVGGFMILVAESLDEAVAVASECPGVIGPGKSLEVREIQTP